MPEGDTLYKIATFMRPRLEGSTLVRAEAMRLSLPQLRGQPVRGVRAVGKHLLVDVGTRWQLRVHLGMQGSWHAYLADAPWQRPAWSASVVLQTDRRQTFVCFRAEDVELSSPVADGASKTLGRLGPCLLSAGYNLDAVVRRALALMGQAPMVDTLLDQRVAAGLGNVYKSELLFIFNVHPQTHTADVGATGLGQIYARARALLQQNVGSWARTTTHDPRPLYAGQGAPLAVAPSSRQPRLWVYRRHGAPCLRCPETIAWARLGRQRRGTYWCPRCQPASNTD